MEQEAERLRIEKAAQLLENEAALSARLESELQAQRVRLESEAQAHSARLESELQAALAAVARLQAELQALCDEKAALLRENAAFRTALSTERSEAAERERERERSTASEREAVQRLEKRVAEAAGAQFTCFSGTKVQILTQLRRGGKESARQSFKLLVYQVFSS